MTSARRCICTKAIAADLSTAVALGPVDVIPGASALKSRHFFALPLADQVARVKPLAAIAARHNSVAVHLSNVCLSLQISAQISARFFKCPHAGLCNDQPHERGERSWRIFSDGCPLQSFAAR